MAQIVRADDCRIASNISAANPAFLNNRDILSVKFARQILRSCQAVTTPGDNNIESQFDSDERQTGVQPLCPVIASLKMLIAE